MPERLECEVLQKARYINTLTFTFTFTFTFTSGLSGIISEIKQNISRKPRLFMH